MKVPDSVWWDAEGVESDGSGGYLGEKGERGKAKGKKGRAKKGNTHRIVQKRVQSSTISQ